jgi:hypothetical protein
MKKRRKAMGMGGICLGLGILLGQPPQMPVVAPEVTVAVPERSLEVPARTGVAAVEGLSKQLGWPIVAWLSPSYHPRVYKGKAAEVLAQLAQEQEIVWRRGGHILLGVWAADRLRADPPTAAEIAQECQMLRRNTHIPVQLPHCLLLALKEEQLQRLGQGEALGLADMLTPQQQRLFRDLFESNTNLLYQKLKRKIDIKEYRVYYALAYSGILFWRGQAIEIGHWPPSRWRANFYWEDCQAIYRRNFAQVAAQARKLFRDEVIVLQQATAFSVSALAKQLAVLLRDKEKQLIVSAQVGPQQIVVSAGKWSAADLAAAVALVGHLEWRLLEEVVFWGLTPEAVRLREAREIAHRCDVAWAVYGPIYRAWQNNPRNRVLTLSVFQAPQFSYAEVYPPRLVAWQAWTPAEKQYVQYLLSLVIPIRDSKAQAQKAAEVLEKYATDLELFLYPSILFEYLVPGFPLASMSGGDWSYTYGWIATRFGRGSRTPIIRLPAEAEGTK